jgi:hypothetical protein
LAFSLSRNGRKIVLYGQLLAANADPSDTAAFTSRVEAEPDSSHREPPDRRGEPQQELLFREK